MAVITKCFSRLTLIPPENEQWSQNGHNVLCTYHGGVEGVHPGVNPVTTHINIIDAFRASYETDITHERTCAAVGAASHTYAQWLTTQAQFVDLGLKLLHKI